MNVGIHTFGRVRQRNVFVQTSIETLVRVQDCLRLHLAGFQLWSFVDIWSMTCAGDALHWNIKRVVVWSSVRGFEVLPRQIARRTDAMRGRPSLLRVSDALKPEFFPQIQVKKKTYG